MHRIEVNVQTGEIKKIELTQEEIQELEQRAIDAAESTEQIKEALNVTQA
jgi:Fic family protein